MTTADPSARDRLLAILLADVKGYSRLMALDDKRTVAALDAGRAVFREQIASHGGRVVDMAGDSVLAVFETAAGAVGAAMCVQRQLSLFDPDLPETHRMRFRIGIHVGDVIEKSDGTVYGHGVNIAARLESLALAGGIVVSETVYGIVSQRLPLAFEAMGPQTVKNIVAPVPAYRVRRAESELPAGNSGVDNAAEAGSGSTSVPPGLQRRHVTNLPEQLEPLYGRDDDMASVESALEKHRLVTLVGTSGIGKSRLAQASAHALLSRYVDGAWMVELAGLSDPTRILNTVANALNIMLGGSGDAATDLLARLSTRSLLLVIDNCEHLLEEASRIAGLILQGCPGVRLLATSQIPLGLADEQQLRLAPLSVPASMDDVAGRAFGALDLFCARVRAIDARFEIDSSALPVVIHICHRLDGLPLAIELAAARVPHLGLVAVRDRLDERFRLLTGKARNHTSRHQTLRAALEWSHALLTEQEQRIFRRLGVFAGGFTMRMAQIALGGEHLDEWDVMDAVCALADKSLVTVDGVQQPRYTLLESARAFALERLVASEEDVLMAKRHAQAVDDCLARADDAFLDGTLRSADRADILMPEIDNVRAAYAWASLPDGDAAIAVLLAARAGSLDELATEVVRWLQRHRDTVEAGVPSAVAARYWFTLSSIAMFDLIPRWQQLEAARIAEGLYRTLGYPKRVYACLLEQARYERLSGNLAQARLAADLARTLIEPSWPSLMRSSLLHMDSGIARADGHVELALRLARQRVEVAASSDDWEAEVDARMWLIDLLWEMEPIEHAATEIDLLANQLLERPVGAAYTAFIMGNMIGIFSECGKLMEAIATADVALPLMKRSLGYNLDAMTFLFWRCGRPEIATIALGASDAKLASDRSAREQNEVRLIDCARPALELAMGAAAYVESTTKGGSMTVLELHALMVRTVSELSKSADRL